MQKSVKIFSNTNFNLSISDRHGFRVKNYTYIYLINIYCTLKYISLIYIYIYMKFLKVLVCYMKHYQKIDK